VIARPQPVIRSAAILVLAAAAGVGLLLWVSHSPSRPFASTHNAPGSVDPLIHRQTVIGRSVRGRPVIAVAIGDPDAPKRLVVIGCIHGDERAGMAIARRLDSGVAQRNALLWVINDLNPDGAAAGTRQNARGVDLNRNFPWRWRRLGHPGDLQYSGPKPLSEPESRIARALILRVRPLITIWFHQPLGLVDESGGNPRVERRFARLAGFPLEQLPRYPGSAAGWQNHRLAHSTAFVVELPPGRPSPKLAVRLARAVREIASKTRTLTVA
jgi:murein peptide amidase A